MEKSGVKKMHFSQRAVWRQSGCLLADTSVVIWKLTARRSLSEPPPERQAAGRCVQVGGQRMRIKRILETERFITNLILIF